MKHLKYLAPAISLASILFSADAWSTHKAWRLHDAGTTCQPASSDDEPNFGYLTGSIRNNHPSSSRSVVCPVTLAGRFGASSTPFWGSFNMTQSMRAGDGDVFVFDGSSSSNVSCYAYTRAQSGSSYYSRSVSSSGTGSQTLHVFDKSTHSWGSGMADNDIAIWSIGYRCSLPPSSYVYGYMVNLCQITAEACTP